MKSAHRLVLWGGLFAVMACLVLPARAQLYKWVDEKGVTHYSDQKPYSGKSEVIKVPGMADPAPPESAASASASASATLPAAPAQKAPASAPAAVPRGEAAFLKPQAAGKDAFGPAEAATCNTWAKAVSSTPAGKVAPEAPKVCLGRDYRCLRPKDKAAELVCDAFVNNKGTATVTTETR